MPFAQALTGQKVTTPGTSTVAKFKTQILRIARFQLAKNQASSKRLQYVKTIAFPPITRRVMIQSFLRRLSLYTFCAAWAAFRAITAEVLRVKNPKRLRIAAAKILSFLKPTPPRPFLIILYPVFSYLRLRGKPPHSCSTQCVNAATPHIGVAAQSESVATLCVSEAVCRIGAAACKERHATDKQPFQFFLVQNDDRGAL